MIAGLNLEGFQPVFSVDAVQIFIHNGADVLIGDGGLFVRNFLEPVEGGVNSLVIQGIPQLLQPLAEGVASAELAQQQHIFVQADVRRPHDLVRFPIFQHSVLVDARFVGKGVLPHNGLSGGNGNGGERSRHAAGADQFLCIYTGLGAQNIPAYMERHDDLLQRGVARPLSQPVDRTLHPGRPCLYRC